MLVQNVFAEGLLAGFRGVQRPRSMMSRPHPIEDSVEGFDPAVVVVVEESLQERVPLSDGSLHWSG